MQLQNKFWFKIECTVLYIYTHIWDTMSDQHINRKQHIVITNYNNNVSLSQVTTRNIILHAFAAATKYPLQICLWSHVSGTPDVPAKLVYQGMNPVVLSSVLSVLQLSMLLRKGFLKLTPKCIEQNDSITSIVLSLADPNFSLTAVHDKLIYTRLSGIRIETIIVQLDL